MHLSLVGFLLANSILTNIDGHPECSSFKGQKIKLIWRLVIYDGRPGGGGRRVCMYIDLKYLKLIQNYLIGMNPPVPTEKHLMKKIDA
jgi:hypothetical protein